MKKYKKISFGIALTLLLSLFATGIHTFQGDFFEKLNITERNLSARLYHERDISDEILIVAIDEKTLSEPEKGGLDRQAKWNRTYYAKVLENIEAGQPSAVFFDILFSSETDGLKSGDIYKLAEQYPKIEDFTEQVLKYLDPPHPYDEAFRDVLAVYDNVYLLKSMQQELGWDNKTLAMLYKGAVEPIELFKEFVHTSFSRVTAVDESLNSSMIFSVPRYYLESGDSQREQGVDFQLVEAHLDRLLTEQEIPIKNGQMLVNYAGIPSSFNTVSFSDVYNGKVDSNVFEGKIVLIGATAAILQDRHFTPIDSSAPMAGIEIHANVIQTILDEAYLQDQGSGDFFIQSFFSLTLIVLIALLAPLWVSGIATLLMLSLFPFYASLRFDHGTIISLILPPISLILAYVAVLAYRNFTEFSEKRKLKAAFSRYVSPELVEQITQEPERLKLGGERRNITALFLDIENFTNLSEGLEAQEVVRIINIYFGALARVIMDMGGSVDKYEGDAIMALFGAPVPDLTHPLKACLASLAIQEKVEELNKKTGYKLAVRVGLATGDAIVGNMGSSERFDYTAMGDTVNIASRLEGANKFYHTPILVNQGTFEATHEQIFFRKIDIVCLKGKDSPIGIYEIMGTQEGASEAGKKLIEEWHEALAHYQKAEWNEAENKIKNILKSLPNDGPAQTFLRRITDIKSLPEQEQARLRREWDGVWHFESK